MPRVVGFRNPHISEVAEDTFDKYQSQEGKPYKLGRGIGCKISPKMESEEWESDDTVEEKVYGNEIYEFELTINEMTLEDKVMLYGGKIIKGVYIPPAIFRPKKVALGFEARKSNKKYKKMWFYSGQFELPEGEYETLKKKPEGKPIVIKGTFYKRQKDGLPYIEFDEDSKDADLSLGDKWFDSVQEPPTEA